MNYNESYILPIFGHLLIEKNYFVLIRVNISNSSFRAWIHICNEEKTGKRKKYFAQAVVKCFWPIQK